MLKLHTDKGDSKHTLMALVLFSLPRELLFVFIGRTLQVALTICIPFLVQEAVEFLDSPTASVNVGYGLIGGFFCVSLGIAVSWPNLCSNISY
jgi:hypothetical protein